MGLNFFPTQITNKIYGRAQTNYALALMDRREYLAALPYLQRGHQLMPDYSLNNASLGIALGELRRDSEAEPHFRRAIEKDPRDAEMYFYYARWLNERARTEEAVKMLMISISRNSTYMGSRYLLMEIYAGHGVWDELKALAQDCLAVNPYDPVAPRYLGMEQQLHAHVSGFEEYIRSHPTPENYLRLSSEYHQAGRYAECIAAAREAARLKPDFAEAYNNMAAAYASLGQWDNAIAAAREALRLKPGFDFARKNIELAIAQKSAGGGAK